MDALFLGLMLFCGAYSYYLHGFISRHGGEGADARRREQALAYRSHGLVKKLALGAVLAALIVFSDLILHR